jgi:hypothetical protein
MMRYGSHQYELFDTEAEAARRAVGIGDSGEAAVIGIQFADGRLINRDDWQAYKDADGEAYKAMIERSREERRHPRRVTRKIRDPFSSVEVSVYADEAPEWLGAP